MTQKVIHEKVSCIYLRFICICPQIVSRQFFLDFLYFEGISNQLSLYKQTYRTPMIKFSKLLTLNPISISAGVFMGSSNILTQYEDKMVKFRMYVNFCKNTNNHSN